MQTNKDTSWSRTYLAHHELESRFIVISFIIRTEHKLIS